MATIYGSINFFTNRSAKFFNTADTHFVALRSPASQGSDLTFVLPGADLTNGVLVSDGSANFSLALLVNANIASAAAIAVNKLAALTVSRAVVTDGSGFISAATTTSTEIGYVNGVTSAIQTQIDGKASLSGATFTGPIVLSGDATAALNPVSKQQFDAAITGLESKSEVYVAATTNVAALTGEQTIDGALTSTSRVLLTGQTAPAQNGIYVTAAGAWTRAVDFDSWAEIPGALVPVGPAGTANKNTLWMCTVAPGGTLGTTAITFINVGFIPVNLATQVTGTLPVGNGGTNSATALSNNRFIVSSGSAIVEAAAVTASRAVVSDTNGLPTASATTATEIGFVSGVTSAIQTQLNGKASTALNNLTVSGLTADDLLYASSSSAVTRLPIGTTGQVLTVVGGAPAWAAASTVSSFKANWVTGDGTTKTITHNLGTLDVIVQIYDKADGSTIMIDSEVRTDTNTLTVTASEAPNASGWRVLILAI